MRKPGEYEGHRNWNHWNVALWLANDEGLYRLALQLRRECHTVTRAAECMLSELHSGGLHKTPDGAPYSKTTLRAAIAGLE